MTRILEPELMDDEKQAIAYSQADFGSSNQRFLDYILKDYSGPLERVIDLGCGPGDIDIAFAKAAPDTHILAVDGADVMIKLARENVAQAGLQNQIQLRETKIPGLTIDERKPDLIISKDLLHHLPNPMILWEEVERLAGPETYIYVMDLIRPASEEIAKEMVERVCGNEAEVLKRDFFNSLLAAFTIEEVSEQLSKTNLKHMIQYIGERHFIVKCQMDIA
ncbi:MAG: class I SAM-dependent methyltransferase [Saprospiraceae bacterium]|nr:class I SAM-dependent methyltransferase [Saprospiraceae bacterium]